MDAPYVLLQQEDSLLSKMVQETGEMESAKLIEMARKSELGGALLPENSDGKEEVLETNDVRLSTDNISNSSIQSEGS